MPSKDIPWLRVGVEGVVIVGSILLAFALDAWWDDRNREDELLAQLEVVAGEMQSTQAALQRVLNGHAVKADLAEHLTSALSQVAEGSEVGVSDTLVGRLFLQATADVATESLDVFIAGGGLELIEDPGIRGELLAWPSRIDDLLDDEIYLRDFAAADLISYLRANAAVANAQLQAISWMRQARGGPQVAPDLLGTVTLRRERQLMNLLAAVESEERELQSVLVNMLDQVARIVAALEESR